MSVPTLKPVVLVHRMKSDGTYNVKIRVTHDRKIRYLPTTVFVTKSDLDKNMNLKSTVVLRLTPIILSVQNAIDKMSVFDVEAMDVDDLVKHIERELRPRERFQLDFFVYGEKVAASKPKYSGNNYRTALNSFESFIGKRELDIASVTSSMMRRFESYLVEKHGKDARAVSLYTSALATIHSEARKEYNDNESGSVVIANPFEYYTPPKQKPAPKRTLDADVIQKLIDARAELTSYHREAVDVFLISFALMGTNVPDIYDAVMAGENVITYNRTKTKSRRYDKAEMFIRLEDVAMKLFDEYRDPSGKRAFRLYQRYSFYKSIADKGNDRLKEVAEKIGVKPFTMYAARHTWASIAYSTGIPKSLINDCLCHVDPDMSVTDIYIKKDWSILWEANRKVLAQFDWSAIK